MRDKYFKPKKGIVVDGSTSGNPGVSKYRGLDLESGKILFEKEIGHSTNNVTEFIALVHGLAYVKKLKLDLIVYSDSQTAIAWVKYKKCNSKITLSAKTEESICLYTRAEVWLRDNEVLVNKDYDKWKTRFWLENPADYGNK